MCGRKNCNKVERTFAIIKYRDKTIETGNSNPQCWVVEYGWKSKGDRKSNARIGEWISLSKGSGWTSSTNSLPRSQSALDVAYRE